MRYFLSFLIMLINSVSFSQDVRLSVFIRDEVINVTTANENKDKILLLNKAQFSDDDVLKIRVSTTIDTARKRNFYVYDNAGSAVCDFILTDDGTYSIEFGQLKKLLQPQQAYFIYTTILPSDPNKAAMMKPGKQLVCAIKIL